MKLTATETPAGIVVGKLTYKRRAWTGGDRPSPTVKRKKHFQALRSFFMREQLRDCLGLDFWKCAGTGSMERARIFWNRATLDAWRTYTYGKAA